MRNVLFFFIAIFIFSSCRQNKSNSEILNVRLQWYPHSQFAGYIVALEKGFYSAEGLKVNLLPAGPDIKPTTTVASGSDHIGIGVPNQIIMARTNKVPLTIIAQIFQDSPNRYVLKTDNRIDSLKQLAGKKVGLWLGGDEAEFISMLSTNNMKLSDLQVIPQEFSVTPFLQDEYILSQVTTYNELIQIENQGYKNKLQILSPSEYQSAILGDMIFCKEELIRNKKETLVKFLKASIKGWQYTIDNPNEALKIILDYNPELEEKQQEQTLNAIIDLVTEGEYEKEGIGHLSLDAYENIQRIMLQSGQIAEKINISDIYTAEILNAVKKEQKILQQ